MAPRYARLPYCHWFCRRAVARIAGARVPAYGGRVTSQPDTASIRPTSLSHGAGCACKLPLSSLDELMASLGPGVHAGASRASAAASPDLLVGAAEGDDAA